MKILKPRYSKFEKIVDVGDGLILLEDDWSPIKGASNLYKVDRNFIIVWEAFRTLTSEPFYDITIEHSEIRAHDGSGYATLNPHTGELSEWVLTK